VRQRGRFLPAHELSLAMGRLITFFTVVAIALWTLLSLGAWAVLSLGGDLVHSQLDWLFFGDPDAVPVASAVFRFFQNLGIGLVFAIWFGGAAIIWLCGFILKRIARGAVVQPVDPGWAYRVHGDEPRPMKDVTPPRPTRALSRD
jgi:hypothetical protein